MANNFGTVSALPFQGVTYRLPVKLPQGVATPPNRVPPSFCPVTIDWNVYWQLLGNPANVGVTINLQAASVQASILDRIASVKIDNTDSPTSVYVQFPDSGDVINCPPNCSVTYPCLTNNLIANVFALGLETGFIPTTRIFFYNIDLPPSVDYEVSQSVTLFKASPSITRGTTILNENYGTPALGDQLQGSALLNLGVANQTIRLWNTPYPSGFLYITSFVITLLEITSTPQSQPVISIESTGAAGVLMTPSFFVRSGVPIDNYTLLSMSGMQIKLDATQVWQARSQAIPSGGGFAQIYSSFTQSPI